MKTRIKFKPYEQINVIDILIIYSIINTSENTIYVYIDDRSDYCDDGTIIKTKVLLKKINLDISRMIFIKYTDFYNLAWIYLHKLMMRNKITIESNTWKNYHNDYDNIMKNKNNLKIYLTYEKNERYMDKCNNLLYDCGWFRESFLQLIMDDSYQIDNILDEKSLHSTELLIKILNLHCPHYNHNHIQTTHIVEPVIINKSKHNIFDLSLDNMCHLKMNIPTLVYLFENKNYYLDDLNNYYVECVVNKCNNESNLNPWCLIDPIKIILEEPKVLEVSTICDYVYVQKYDHVDGQKIRLKHAGALFVYTKNNIYYGKWLHSSKKKKIKKILEWTTSCDQNIYHIINPLGLCPEGRDRCCNINRLIILSSNHVDYDDKILKINSDFYVRDIENKQLTKINNIGNYP